MTQAYPVSFHAPPLRGRRRPVLALVGLPGTGKTTLFRAVESTGVRSGTLTGAGQRYDECEVRIGLAEARVVDLPGMASLRHLAAQDLPTLKYLLWGDRRPPVSSHEEVGPPAPIAAPDVIIQVADAETLERDLELTLDLLMLGRPFVLAVNRMDEARRRGLGVDAQVLASALGVRVVCSSALMGEGVAAVFAAAVEAARSGVCPLPVTAAPHVAAQLWPLARVLAAPEVSGAFRLPPRFLASQIAQGEGYFADELARHVPAAHEEVLRLRAAADRALPRSLSEELHADRHHRAASLFETCTRVAAAPKRRGWRAWLDLVLLDPRWGLAGSIGVFSAVLFIVFKISPWLDGLTSAPLGTWVATWQPESTAGVVARAVADALVGLVGIVVPYMVPLVLLLVVLEQTGVMARIAFVLDRTFHRIGVHGRVAVPMLLGLGCNVPAISEIAATSRGRERVVASVLVTFVPCSARSAIILALAGKYLGVPGVLAVFGIALAVIALLGQLLRRHYRHAGPGEIQPIPQYALPRLRPLAHELWARTRDIVTIVTPLLVVGSIVLALMHHAGMDGALNRALAPVTAGWLGLPLALGVPILFGVLRKELSLLMVYQALGTLDIGRYMQAAQLLTFVVFLTLYLPCLSTFAVMLKRIGRREAVFSAAISVGVALAVSGLVRFVLEGAGALTG